MYFCMTDELLRGVRGWQRQAIDEYENAGDTPGTAIGSVFRVGVLIADDCTSIDVAKVLAKTCERFGGEQREANNGSKISVTIIADRAGFLLRENSSIPVWCEAIGDVNPEDFHYFVVPRPAIDAFVPRSEIISWLAQVGRGAKVISLSLDAEKASGADENSGHSLEWTVGARRIDAVHADGRKASGIAMDVERRVG
jgi:hypothetical protein